MRIAIAGLVLAALLAGTAAAAPRARSPYAKSLASLCTDTRKRIEKIPAARTPRELTRTTAQVDALGRSFVLRLARLRPSPRERIVATEMGRLYAAYWSGEIRAFVFLRQGIENGKPDLVNLYTRSLMVLGPYAERAEQLATRLGARECARQPVRK